MSEPLPYRYQIDERHGDGPWANQFYREMTEGEAEGFTMLLCGVARALDDKRVDLDWLARFCAELLDIKYEVYRDLMPDERLALIMSRSGDNVQSAS